MAAQFDLFGPPDLGSQWKKTPLGINYNAHGYDEPRHAKKRLKRINRALKHLKGLDTSQTLRNEFVAYYDAFPESLAGWLDGAFRKIQTERWKPCARQYPILAHIQPGSLRIEILPHAFWVPAANQWACGMVEPRTGLITLAVAAVSKATKEATAPNWLRRVDDLARWEVGNYGAHFVLKIRNREVGDKPLC